MCDSEWGSCVVCVAGARTASTVVGDGTCGGWISRVRPLCVAQWRDRCRCATEARALRRARTVRPCQTAASEQRATVAQPPPDCPPLRGEMICLLHRARYVAMDCTSIRGARDSGARMRCPDANALLRGDWQVKEGLSTILSAGKARLEHILTERTQLCFVGCRLRPLEGGV